MNQSADKDSSSLIKVGDKVLGFSINGKEFTADFDGEFGCVQVKVGDLKGFRISSIPENFFLRLIEEHIINFWGSSGYISRGRHAYGEANVEYIVYKDCWRHKYGIMEYLNKMEKAVNLREESENDVFSPSIEEEIEYASCEFTVAFDANLTIDQAYKKTRHIIEEIEADVEELLEHPNTFLPTFENGGFWEYYRDLETQLEKYLIYVPYIAGNEYTYSFRLANLLLAIGAHVDSALKEMGRSSEFSAKYPEIRYPRTKDGKNRDPKIIDYLPISNDYGLDKRLVTFKCLPNREPVYPFQEYQAKEGRIKVPYWWSAYNKVKHNFNKNFNKANLKTVRDALAGAFLLNVVNSPSAIRLYKHGILKTRMPYAGTLGIYIEVGSTLGMVIDCLEKRKSFQGDIETPLFRYSYSQSEQE